MKPRRAVRAACGLAALAVGASACGGGEPPPQAPAAPASAAPSGAVADTGGKTVLKGVVTLTQSLASYAPRGQLAVGWLTPDEAHAFEQGSVTVRTLRELATDRLVAAGLADFLTLATAVPFELEAPDEDVVPFALVDVCGDVFKSLTNSCDGSVVGFGAVVHPKKGARTKANVELTKRTSMSTPPERCAGERMDLVRIEAPKTAGAVHNPTSRRLCVRVPASYPKHSARRYPVIYALPGLGGTDTSFFSRKVDLDAVEKDAGREAIIVSVDTSTRTGSTYLTDSPTEGDFDSFLALDVPVAVDKAYRTLAHGKGRALIGQSTGGFNAVSFGLRHSAAFGAIAAMSPDGLDLGAWLAPDGKAMAAPWLHLMRLEDAMKSAGEMSSLAASFSPDASNPKGFDWPADLTTGALDAAVWSRWLAYSPSALLTQPKVLEEAKTNLSGRVMVTVAEGDEFDLFEPAKRFVDQAVAVGVKATLTPTKGGHLEGIAEREQAALKFLLEALDAAKP